MGNKTLPSPLQFPSSLTHCTSKGISVTWHTRPIPLSDPAGAGARQKACFPQPFTLFDHWLLLIWHCPHTSNDFPLAERTSHLSPGIKGITLRPDKAYGHKLCCQREAPQLPPFPIQLPLFCWVLGPGHQWQQKGLYTSCEAQPSWIYIFSSRLHRLLKCSELHGGYYEIHNQQMLWKVCLNPLSL